MKVVRIVETAVLRIEVEDAGPAGGHPVLLLGTIPTA
jgi:hypothetical protein